MLWDDNRQKLYWLQGRKAQNFVSGGMEQCPKAKTLKNFHAKGSSEQSSSAMSNHKIWICDLSYPNRRILAIDSSSKKEQQNRTIDSGGPRRRACAAMFSLDGMIQLHGGSISE